jgi:hypothetical protein
MGGRIGRFFRRKVLATGWKLGILRDNAMAMTSSRELFRRGLTHISKSKGGNPP